MALFDQNILQVLHTSIFLLIFDWCILHLLDQRSLILKLIIRCDYKLSVVHTQIGHTDLLPQQACGRSWRGWQFCIFTCHYQLIDWIQGDHLKVFLLISVKFCLSSGRSIYSKKSSVVVIVWWLKTVVVFRVSPRGTKFHWVNTLQFSATLHWLQLQRNPLIYNNHPQTRHSFKRYIFIKVFWQDKWTTKYSSFWKTIFGSESLVVQFFWDKSWPMGHWF